MIAPNLPRSPSTFLLTSSTAPGHLLRVLDLASQLTRRGHRVLMKAKADTTTDVAAVGAELVPYERVVDLLDDAAHHEAFDSLGWFPRLLSVAWMRSLLASRNVVLARELAPVLRRERVDCVVYDYFEFGAAWAAELAGIPCASAGNLGTVLTGDELPLMLRELPGMGALGRAPALVHAALGRLVPLAAARARLGLPPYAGRVADLVRAMISRDLHIVMAPPGLAGDAPLRDRQVFAGPTSYNRADTPAELPGVEPGTVVVSTTTTPGDGGLFRRVLEAVAPMQVPVLATVAGAEDVPSGLGAHVRIERYVAHDAVFPHARALVTHGGWGTVGRALTHGLPMLVIPLFGDQPMNARMVAHTGLGYRLSRRDATAAAIRENLTALLTDDAVRARAGQVAAEIAAQRASQVAARALEQLAERRSAA